MKKLMTLVGLAGIVLVGCPKDDKPKEPTETTFNGAPTVPVKGE